MKKIFLVLVGILLTGNFMEAQVESESKGIPEIIKEYKLLENSFKVLDTSGYNTLMKGVDPAFKSQMDFTKRLSEIDNRTLMMLLQDSGISTQLNKELNDIQQKIQKLEDSIGSAVEKDEENVIAEKYSVPNFPALSFISSDVDDVSKPSSSRELATSLINAIDASGKVKQGLAVEISPFKLLGVKINTEEYRKRSLKSILYDTQLSIGTVATSGDSTKTDLGWGIRIVLFDNSDLMRKKSFTKKLGDAMQLCASKSPDDVDEEEELKCLAQKLEETKEYFEKEQTKEKIKEIENYHNGIYWNADWLTLSYAGGLRLNDSNIHEGSVVGHQVWIAGGTGFNSNWFLLSFQGKWSRTLQDTSSTFLEEFVAATRAEIRFKAKIPWNLFGEVQYSPLLNKDDFENDPNIDVDKEFTWSAGTEFKVAKNFWAVVGIGENAEKIVGTDGIQLLTGLRMGILNKNK